MAETLKCPACRSGQPGRRGDPLCPACGRAAGEVAPDPTWVFDSPLLRDALAAAKVPAVLAIVRSASGLSQRDMAGVAGWSPAALSYYERGRRDAVFDIRVLLQFADAAGMPRAALLALVLGDPDAAAGNADEPVLMAAESSPDRQPVTGALLRYWQACTDGLYGREQKTSGASLLGPALLLWEQLRSALRTATDGGPELSAVAAGAALCAARFATDAGRLPLAGSLHAAARDLAADGGDAMLCVQVLVNQASFEAEAARSGGGRDPARRALLLAREAAEEGRYLPVPELHALIAVAQADAAALLGDGAVSGAAITRARRELDRAGDTAGLPTPAWLRHVDHDYVAMAEDRQRTATLRCLTPSVKAAHAARVNTSLPPSGRAESRTA